MHFTRRRLDRSAGRALLAAGFLAAGSAAASCSSSSPADAVSGPTEDAAVDAAMNPKIDADADAGSPSPRDAGWVDVAALPIVCASPPCATALVTTLGDGAHDLGEGFCALLSDGTVACWGANHAGQLGRGEDAGTTASSRPARVLGLSDVVMLDHTCALDKNGAIWCWGTGPFLRDDAGVPTRERAPTKLGLAPASKIGVGYGTACAAIGAEVVCWGSNADGQLSPPSDRSEYYGGPRPMTLPPGAPVRGIAVGRATFILREDGTLITWGANPAIGRVSPIFPDSHPQEVALGGIFMVDLADDNACATAGGTGYCWGTPVVPPSPGNGSVTERGLPDPVVAPEPVVQITTTRTTPLENGEMQRYRWCASSVSGAVYCWGSNDSGQAGDGKQSYAFDAVKVAGLPAPAAQVKATPNATCALLTDGSIYCWGSNHTGQLGNGQIKGRSFVPVKVVLP